jgi:hypothetical protein
MKIAAGLMALLFAASSNPALADMTATYAAPGNAFAMTVEIATSGDIRVSTSNPNSYFVWHDGHSYMVQATFNGPAVMRMEDVGAVMVEQMKKLTSGMGMPKDKDFPIMGLTKGPEVEIRGRRGTAYYMGSETKHQPAERPAVVISSDPTLAPLGAAMSLEFEMSNTIMGKVLGGHSPFAEMTTVLKSGAPLQFAGAELDTVKNDPIAESRFSLPATPLSIDKVRENMGATSPQD